MIIGQKVVCVNDVFPAAVRELYKELPKAGVVYVIRRVSIGCNWKAEPGEVCLHLIGLSNPRSTVKPYPERGFNAERFKPLDEVQGRASRANECVDAIAAFVPSHAGKDYGWNK